MRYRIKAKFDYSFNMYFYHIQRYFLGIWWPTMLLSASQEGAEEKLLNKVQGKLNFVVKEYNIE